MANLSPVALIVILAACVVVSLVIGYLIGSRAGGRGASGAVDREKQKLEDFKTEVREHFQQTAAIMSRMVDDYRHMYEHMSQGAEKLADLSQEKMVTPPPAPDAITRQAGETPARAGHAASAADQPPDHHADSVAGRHANVTLPSEGDAYASDQSEADKTRG